MVVNIYTDGGSRGNPGISGIGYVIKNENEVIYQNSKFIGVTTNNRAEYTALIEAVTTLLNLNLIYNQVNFYSDSELMVRQLNGLYKVKSPNVLDLYGQVRTLLSRLNCNYQFIHILRNKNFLADQLANSAMDQQL
jgi:ribonuclease HI